MRGSWSAAWTSWARASKQRRSRQPARPVRPTPSSTIACGDEVNAECVRYLNRLSDLLFILSRGANLAVSGEEPLWQPGAGQS